MCIFLLIEWRLNSFEGRLASGNDDIESYISYNKFITEYLDLSGQGKFKNPRQDF